MKKLFSVLLCTLLYTVSFSQEVEKEQDSTQTKIIKIDEVIVVGKLKK